MEEFLKLQGYKNLSVTTRVQNILKRLNIGNLNDVRGNENLILNYLLKKNYRLNTIRCYASFFNLVMKYLGKERSVFSDISRYANIGVNKRINKEQKKAYESISVMKKDREERYVNILEPPQRASEQRLPVVEQIRYFTNNLRYRKGIEVKGNLLPLKTAKQYEKYMIDFYRAFVNEHKEFDENMSFLVTNHADVINLLNRMISDKVNMNKIKKIESSIVHYLPLVTKTYKEFMDSFDVYTAWLKKLPRHLPGKKKAWYGLDYRNKKKKQYIVYDWEILKETMLHLLDTVKELRCDDNPEYCQMRLLIMLFVYQAPRRSKDYTRLRVITKESHITNEQCNFLFLNGDKSEFVFNFYKTRQERTRAQRIRIRERVLLDELVFFYEKHRKKHEYLFTFKDELAVQRTMQIKIGQKYQVPFRINPLRHFYATWFWQTKGNTHLKECAEQMGTRVKDLHIYYITPYDATKPNDFSKVYPPKLNEKFEIEKDYEDSDNETETTLTESEERKTEKNTKNRSKKNIKKKTSSRRV